jgi:hypothetical protein
VQKYGWGYMSQYMKQGAEWRRASAWGEAQLSLSITVSSFRERRPECDTIALTGGTEDLLPVAFVAEAILKKARHAILHGNQPCMLATPCWPRH